MGSERQQVQHCDQHRRSVVSLEDIRGLRLEDVFVADELHSARREQLHVHGRPMGQLEPYEEHLCVATVNYIGHHGEHEEYGKLGCGC
jgi:hypothetical protein